MSSNLIACPGCGALVPDTDGATHRYIGASPGCWEIYGEVLAREYSNAGYFSVHQLTVDAYAAQHPGVPSPQSIKSVAVHLLSLYHIFEKDYGMNSTAPIMQRAASELTDQFVWLEPPASLGAITALDVHAAADAVEHVQRVREWAASVWEAWAQHHDQVRAWAARLNLD